MRTTVMFPPELMRAAKARSAELGESLKTLLTRAVEAELGRQPTLMPGRARVALPIFGGANGPPVRLSAVDLERALADAEAATVQAHQARTAGQRRRKSR